MAPVASDITVVADVPGKYQDLGLRTIADQTPDCGPLGGLVAALHDRVERRGRGWLLLASCDLVGVSPDWVRLLAREINGSRPIVLFRGARLEPLLALYHSDVLPLAEKRLSDDERALWRLVEAAGHIEIPLPANLLRLPQANTPDQLPGDAQRGSGGEG